MFFQCIASTNIVWNNYTDLLKQDPACLNLSLLSLFNAWFKVVSVLQKLLPLRAKTYQTYGQSRSSKGNERLFEKMGRRACPRDWSRRFCFRSSRASMFVQSCWIICAYSQTRSVQASGRIFEENNNRGSAPAFGLGFRPFCKSGCHSADKVPTHMASQLVSKATGGSVRKLLVVLGRRFETDWFCLRSNRASSVELKHQPYSPQVVWRTAGGLLVGSLG